VEAVSALVDALPPVPAWHAGDSIPPVKLHMEEVEAKQMPESVDDASAAEVSLIKM